jgi:putative ABC transport system permease protein
MVLLRLTLLAGLGIAAGAAASLWATRFVAPLLFQLPSRDPFTFGVAAAVLGLVAVAAGWLPARRAARIDPAVVLREG